MVSWRNVFFYHASYIIKTVLKLAIIRQSISFGNFGPNGCSSTAIHLYMYLL